MTTNINADSGSLAIRSSISQVESALSEFDRISTGLADLAARHPVDLVFDVASPKGMKEAIAHRAAWRDPRLAVERVRKQAKAPVLALGKDIDARAAWITEQLLLGEEPVQQLIKAEEERREAERQAKINAELARTMAIQEALSEIHMEAMAYLSKPSTLIEAKLAEMTARTLDPTVFQEALAQAEAARRAAVDKLTMALAAARHTEAEAERVAAEREELARLRMAETARKAQEAAAALEARKVEDERRAAERRAEDARIAEDRKRADEAAAAARAEADRVAREQLDARVAEIERQALERLAAERVAREAEQARQLADLELIHEADRAEAAAFFAANAEQKRLHDAAPKLLAALQKLVAVVTGYAPISPLLTAAIEEANAVIAQATGEAV